MRLTRRQFLQIVGASSLGVTYLSGSPYAHATTTAAFSTLIDVARCLGCRSCEAACKQTHGFPAGAADGHHLVNRSAADAVYLEIGDRVPGEEVEYPDIDLRYRDVAGKDVFTRKDGTPY